MITRDEHDDDLEPEVIEGAEIETEQYEEADEEDVTPQAEATNSAGIPSNPEEEPESEPSDTL